MAVLYITEFANVGGAPSGNVMQAAMTVPIAEQTLAIGGSSVASSAFNVATQFVRITSDAICLIAFGSAPVAQAVSGTNVGAAAKGTMRISANSVEYFAVGSGQKVATISTS